MKPLSLIILTCLLVSCHSLQRGGNTPELGTLPSDQPASQQQTETKQWWKKITFDDALKISGMTTPFVLFIYAFWNKKH